VCVICRCSLPSVFIRHRSSLPSVWRVNTIHLPSGEIEASASYTWLLVSRLTSLPSGFEV
jgi:hypothetical protein